MSDYDARLIDLYDQDNPDSQENDFYRAEAEQFAATSILDLGCGTGMLAVTLAREGRTVVGVDPSPGMLAYAQSRLGSETVEWILGDSRDLPAGEFDFVVMTGNVAQHILGTDWDRTLRDLRAHMPTGGVLAFESRNPAIREWERWQSEEPTSRNTMHGTLIEWAEVLAVGAEAVEVAFHNHFLQERETHTEIGHFAFRDRHMLEGQLQSAGFNVEVLYGDWKRTPFSGDAALMVFIARAC
jgi:Methylase involved in ubiquinone/menaquinone biosynthesis